MFRELGGGNKFILKHAEFVLPVEYPKGKVQYTIILKIVKFKEKLRSRDSGFKVISTSNHLRKAGEMEEKGNLRDTKK